MSRLPLLALVLFSLVSFADDEVTDQFIPIGPAPDPVMAVPGFHLKRWFNGAFDRITQLSLPSIR